jgi:hypothetical protein
MQYKKQVSRSGSWALGWSLLGILALFAVCGLSYLRFKSVKHRPTYSNQEQGTAVDPEPEHLKTVAATAGAEDLLKANFRVMSREEDIRPNCRLPFNSSFSRTSGMNSNVELADPGEEFQFSDAITPGLPFRQIIFGGIGATRCFIYYQHGGRMFPSYCLAVMDYQQPKAIWVGESRRRAEDLEKLRLLLLQGQFETSGDAPC